MSSLRGGVAEKELGLYGLVMRAEHSGVAGGKTGGFCLTGDQGQAEQIFPECGKEELGRC